MLYEVAKVQKKPFVYERANGHSDSASRTFTDKRLTPAWRILKYHAPFAVSMPLEQILIQLVVENSMDRIGQFRFDFRYLFCLLEIHGIINIER